MPRKNKTKKRLQKGGSCGVPPSTPQPCNKNPDTSQYLSPCDYLPLDGEKHSRVRVGGRRWRKKQSGGNHPLSKFENEVRSAERRKRIEVRDVNSLIRSLNSVSVYIENSDNQNMKERTTESTLRMIRLLTEKKRTKAATRLIQQALAYAPTLFFVYEDKEVERQVGGSHKAYGSRDVYDSQGVLGENSPVGNICTGTAYQGGQEFVFPTSTVN